MAVDSASIVIVALVVLILLYFMRNEEQYALSDAVRHDLGSSFIRLSEGFTRYELTGPAGGRTVVLVHGLSTYSFTWDATVQPLVQRGYRVLRYDLYGRGFSDRPAAAYGKELFDGQLLELIDALDIKGPVDLIGSSLGGLVATTFAARRPEQVRTTTLIDPAFFYLQRTPVPLAIPLVGGYVGRVFAIPFLARVQTRDFKYPEHHHGYDRLYRLQMQYKGYARAILSTIRNVPRWEAVADLRRVAESGIPLLLLWGIDDRTTPLSVSDRVREIIPGAEFHLIDDTAHMPHYERPDFVNPIMLDFLDRRGA